MELMYIYCKKGLKYTQYNVIDVKGSLNDVSGFKYQ